MRRAGLIVLVTVATACGSGGVVTISTSFTITALDGHGPSPFDVLQGKTIDLRIVLDAPDVSHRSSAIDRANCRSTRATAANAERTASGDGADVVQAQILDPMPEWAADLETCVDTVDGSYRSTLAIQSVIDAINLSFACPSVPPSVTAHDADGYPLLVTLTGSGCTAEILDVSNNRSLGASGFTVDLDTGGGHVP